MENIIVSASFYLVAVTIGVVAGWLIHGYMNQGKNMRMALEFERQTFQKDELLKQLEHKLGESNSLIEQQDDSAEKLQIANLELEKRLSDSEARRASENTAAKEKLEAIKQAREQLEMAFKALSADALKNNNESFLKLANSVLEKYQSSAVSDLEKRQVAIKEMVDPLQESLAKVDNNLRTLEKNRAQGKAGLETQIKQLLESESVLRKETANLVTALRKPGVRGSWGEIQLKRAVEFAGMVEYCDFNLQTSVNTAEGNRLRPDMIINLPNGRSIVVDAKTPMDAYLVAIEAETEEKRDKELNRHARQLRDKIKELGQKRYWDQFEKAPEFVILFLPNEALFSAALEKDGNLINYGSSNRVIPATPTTLIALLMAIAYGWEQEKLTDHARQISALGKDLYDRIAVFAGHFSGIRKNLENMNESYNKSVRSLESRVLISARRFKDLSPSSTSKEIPLIAPIDTHLVSARNFQSDQSEKEEHS